VVFVVVVFVVHFIQSNKRLEKINSPLVKMLSKNIA